jgi:hypothetical protein
MAWENVPRLSTVNGQNVLIDPASGIVTPVADAGVYGVALQTTW